MRQIDDLNLQKRHSRLGIASTIIGGALPLLVTLLLILTMVFAADSVEKNIGKDSSKSLSETFSLIFFIVGMLAPLLHLTGLIFGLIGVFSKKTKKLFPILGIVLNLFFGLIGIGIIVFLFTNTAWTAFR